MHEVAHVSLVSFPAEDVRWRLRFLCRVVLGNHVVTLACDLGIGAIILANVFSVASDRSTTMSPQDRQDFHRDLATAVISCAFTVASFTISVVGFQKFLLVMRSAAKRISRSVSQALQSTADRARRSAPGGGRPATSIRVDQVAPEPPVRPDAEFAMCVQ